MRKIVNWLWCINFYKLKGDIFVKFYLKYGLEGYKMGVVI